MRIKISVSGSPERQHKHINIQKIKFKYKEGDKNPPIIYFDIPKKYQCQLKDVTVIFHNRYGKEMFRSSSVKLNYKYYEENRYYNPGALFQEKSKKINKVQMVVQDIEFETLGKLSNEYLHKVLKKSCNAKTTVITKPKETNIPSWWPSYGVGVFRYIEKGRAMRYRSTLYQEYEPNVIETEFQTPLAKVLTLEVNSTAPT